MPALCGLGRAREYKDGMSAREFFDAKLARSVTETLECLALDDAKKRYGLQFFRYFVQVDVDGSGGIVLDEFYAFYGIAPTRFTERVFGYFDLDKSRELNFQEFLIGIWNLCTFSHKMMCKFGLDLFDVDEAGTIDKYQCDALVRMVYGAEETPEHLLAGIAAMASDKDPTGTMNLDRFDQHVLEFPQLLEPAFALQTTLRERLFGAKWWAEQTALREATHGELETAENILLQKRREELAMARERQAARMKGTGTKSRICPSDSINDANSILLSASGSASESSSAVGSKRPGLSSLDEQIALLMDEIGATETISEEEEADASLYDLPDLEGLSANQQAALEAFQERKQTRLLYRALQRVYREVELRMIALRSRLEAGVDEEASGAMEQYEEVVKRTADARNRLQNWNNKLAEDGKASLDEAERQLYVRCIKETEAAAEAWFLEKEGKQYLKAVGKEHAVRDADADGGTRFGMLSKAQKEKGLKKARNEYIARKSRERSEEIAARFADLKARHEATVDAMRKEFDLLTAEQEEVVPKWQWQKLRLPEQQSGWYFHCPAMDVSLWAEPFLKNNKGVCEDKACHDSATVRCAQCNHEYCRECDKIVHAYGPQRNHLKRTGIAEEELQWRAKVSKLGEFRKIVCKEVCADPVELKRRHMLEEIRAEQRLLEP